MRVAFIGLGNMGGPMACNIAAAGFETVVTDLDESKVASVAARGAKAADNAVDAVDGADVVFTSLPGPAQVCGIARQILPAMERGSIWVDLSTADLETARYRIELASKFGVEVMDAPVTGGVEGAQAGFLGVLVGGEATTYARCLPLFDAIGSRYELLGGHGVGYVAKIAQVMLCYLNTVCLTEALILGVKGGVEPNEMLEIISRSTGRSYVAEQYGPEILQGTYDDSFDLTLAAKDIRLALNLAATVGASLEFTEQVGELYAAAENEFGPTAPHLMAVRRIESLNQLVLHEANSSLVTKG